MKKFFLFAAAAIAAMTVNAKVYDFANITAADVQASVAITEEIKDGAATGKLLIEVPADQSVVTVTLFSDIELRYNSDSKKNIVIDTKNGYFEFPGNGKTSEGKALVVLKTANIGDQIIIEAANKGTGEVSVEAVDGAAGQAVALPAKADGVYTWVEATFTAITANPIIKTPSARVRKITVGGDSQAIDNTNVNAKAEKFFENGQLVIIKNGVRYNALGVQL